jgi:hypothetical protein
MPSITANSSALAPTASASDATLTVDTIGVRRADLMAWRRYWRTESTGNDE